jgi:hypothetical protein
MLLVVWRYWTVARLAAQHRSQRLYRSLFLVHEMARRAALTAAASTAAAATAGSRQSIKQSSTAAASTSSAAVVKRPTVSAYDEMLLHSQRQSMTTAAATAAAGGYARVSVRLASPTAAASTAAAAVPQQQQQQAPATALAAAAPSQQQRLSQQQQHNSSYGANGFSNGYSNGRSSTGDSPAVLFVSGRPHVPPFPTAGGLRWGRGAATVPAVKPLNAKRSSGKPSLTALTDWSEALCEPARERYQRKEVLAAVANFTAYRRCAPLVSSTAST